MKNISLLDFYCKKNPNSKQLFRIMRTSIFLLLFCSFSLMAKNANSQNAKVTINKQDVRLESILSEIESQTNYLFIYKKNVDVNLHKSISVKARPVSEVLSILLHESPIIYKIEGNHIILTKKEITQTPTIKKITGVVTDRAGEPLIGVTITVKGISQGSITDINGKFSLSADIGDVLQFSYIGYIPQTIKLKNLNSLKVFLVEDVKTLDEVVVVGYGSQKRTNLTGAISTVTSQELVDRPASSVTHMLQGRVPGLNITTSSGVPGNTASFNIRGTNSINGGSPLVLVDGVEGDLDRVNPNDIESISVIKDASAAAIYGGRASFGVILVTTKSGSSDGKVQISYSGRVGWTEPTTSTDYENRGYYHVSLVDQFYIPNNGRRYTSYTEEDMKELWERRNDKTEDPARPWTVLDKRNGQNVYLYYANTDWWQYLFKDKKPLQSHNISISGGTNKLKFYLSAGYNSEEGMYRRNTDKFRRINFHSRISADITDWLNISNNTEFFNSNYTYPGLGGINSNISQAQNHGLASFPTQNPDGTSLYTTSLTDYAIMDGLLVILDSEGFRNKTRKDNFKTTTELTLKPLKGLEIKANLTYMLYNQYDIRRQSNGTYSKYPGETSILNTGNFQNQMFEQFAPNEYWATNVFATYQGSVSNKHNYKVTGGFNYETRYNKTVRGTGYNLLSDVLDDFNLIGVDPATNQKRMEVTGGQNEYKLAGFFGRINYDYKGIYLLELSGRYDGTSRFASGHRWGFFPSMSVGWRVSEEKFFSNMKDWCNNLKFRYSFGSLGNQQVGYYDYIRTISIGTTGYLFGGARPSYADISAPSADNLTWDTVQQHNAGVDMTFLDNRLTFTGEYYIRDTKDMLTAGITLPAVYGTSAPKMNSADMRTKGYELSVAWRDQFKLGNKPFSYQLSFTFSDYISEITKFDNPDKLLAKTYYEGMRIGEIWGYRVDGFFATDEEAKNYEVDQRSVNTTINSSSGEYRGVRAGDLKYRDLDGNKTISIGENRVGSSGDREILGNSSPRYQYGTNLAFQWYGFDFNIFFQGIGHIDWYPGREAQAFWGYYNRPYGTFIPKDFQKLCWSEDNPNAYFPRPRTAVALTENSELSTVNDRYLQNIGYCRLKNLTIGYSLPKFLTNKIGLDLVRLYFSGENLAYWSPIKTDYVDPEQARQGGTLKVYPWQKSFTFGVNINF